MSITVEVGYVIVSSSAVLTAVSTRLFIVNRGGGTHDSLRADAVKNAKALALRPHTDNHRFLGGEYLFMVIVNVELTGKT